MKRKTYQTRKVCVVGAAKLYEIPNFVVVTFVPVIHKERTIFVSLLVYVLLSKKSYRSRMIFFYLDLEPTLYKIEGLLKMQDAPSFLLIHYYYPRFFLNQPQRAVVVFSHSYWEKINRGKKNSIGKLFCFFYKIRLFFSSRLKKQKIWNNENDQKVLLCYMFNFLFYFLKIIIQQGEEKGLCTWFICLAKKKRKKKASKCQERSKIQNVIFCGIII